MNPKRPASLNQNLLGIGLLLLVLGLGLSYEFLAPRLQTARSDRDTNQAKLNALTSEVAQLTDAQQSLAATKQQLTARGIDISKADEVLPPTEDLPSLYIQMEDVMKRSGSAGITNPAYQVSDPALDADGTVRIPVTVTGSGSYADLKAFIVRLENNIRPVSLTSVAFATQETNGTSKLTLSATGYVRAIALSSAYASTTANP